MITANKDDEVPGITSRSTRTSKRIRWFVYRRSVLAPHDVVQVRVEEGTLAISHGSFSQRPRLRRVRLTQSVRHIEDSAFIFCTRLAEVNFPDHQNASLLSIGHWAFMGCVALKHLDLSLAVHLQMIGNAAFDDCVLLETVKLPLTGSSLSHLGMSAFSGCVRLWRVEISNTVQRLDRACFASCHSLERIFLPASVSLGELVFQDCRKLTTVTLESVQRLREWSVDTFKNCVQLHTINFGKNTCPRRLWPYVLYQVLHTQGVLVAMGIQSESQRLSIAFNFMSPIIPQYFENGNQA